jgi:hypothetical protein
MMVTLPWWATGSHVLSSRPERKDLRFRLPLMTRLSSAQAMSKEALIKSGPSKGTAFRPSVNARYKGWGFSP